MIEKIKKTLAIQIANQLPAQGIIALGSGTTVDLIINALGEINSKAQFIAASSNTSRSLEVNGLTEISLGKGYREGILVCVDGADQICLEKKIMIKGHGGALVREKIIWNAAQRIITAADYTKLSDEISKAIPVEIVPFAWQTLNIDLLDFGESLHLRERENNVPFLSDNGNYIIDIKVASNTDLVDLQGRLMVVPGVVETGIFGHEWFTNNTLVIGYDDEIREF